METNRTWPGGIGKGDMRIVPRDPRRARQAETLGQGSPRDACAEAGKPRLV